jgi:DNA polymerase-3 subunit gamma/tau
LNEVKSIENHENNEIKNFNVPKTFDEMLNLLLVNKEALLHAQLINNVHLISYSEGSIKIRLKDNTESEILKKLSSTLENITKIKWVVSQSEEKGEKTIVEKQNSELDKNKEQIKSNPHFAEVFKHFPQAEITSIEEKDSN